MNLKKTMNKLKPYISLLLIMAMVPVSTPALQFEISSAHSLDGCELLIAKSADVATITPEGNIVFTVNFTNIGTQDCTGSGVIIQDEVDDNLEFISESHSPEVATFGYYENPPFYFPPYDSATRTLSWNADVISPGETGWVSWTGKAIDPEVCGTYDIFNTAKMTAYEYNEFAEWEYSNTVEASLIKECPDPCRLSIIKSADVATVAPGGDVIFTVNFTNIGAQDCTGSGVIIQDEVDDNLEFTSESHSSEVLTFGYDDSPLYFPDYDPATRTLSWNADVISPGETGWVSWTGKAIDPEVCGTYDIFNTARMTSHEYSPSFDQETFVWENSNTVEVSLDKPCANPAINISKSANPTSLPYGGGNADYTYTVTNPGDVSLSNVNVADDKCGPVNYASGDDGDDMLAINETWIYNCATNLTATTTNTATASGTYNSQTVQDDDTATVTVANPPVDNNPAINISKSANPTSLPNGGGNVNYSYAITNPGNVTLTNITLTDDKCSPVNYTGGDTNANDQLETTETWNYICSKNITQDTTNTAIAAGKYNATDISDTDSATVTVAPPQTCVSNCGGGGSLFPSIRLIKTPAPYQLPREGGLVIYTYLVSNPGYYTITDVVLTDDKCSELKFIEGDKNTDNKLDRNEIWKYACQTNLTETTTNTAVVNGKSIAGSVKDTAKATVYVPKIDLAIKLEKTANPESLSEKGGLVTYSYKVFNKGSKAISDVTLTDDKCGPVNFISGDANKDKKLNTAETWLYTCQSNITKTTINTGTVRGQVDGKYATDTSAAAVRVGKVLGTNIIPKGMPKTGFGGSENISANNLEQMLSAIFILLAIANVEPGSKKRYN